MNEIERLQRAYLEPSAYAGAYLHYVGTVLGRICQTQIAAFVGALLDARSRDACVFFLGNGGSAATASHFVNDLSVGTRCSTRPFRTLSLSDNVAVITAIANDHGYEDVFVRQLQFLCKPEDVVVAISASGNSPNVLSAVRWANAHGALTIGLTGFDGGQLRTLVRLNVHVPTQVGEYGPVEDAHMALDHLVTSYLAAAVQHESVR